MCGGVEMHQTTTPKKNGTRMVILELRAKGLKMAIKTWPKMLRAPLQH
jgi:hypothetical protein